MRCIWDIFQSPKYFSLTAFSGIKLFLLLYSFSFLVMIIIFFLLLHPTFCSFSPSPQDTSGQLVFSQGFVCNITGYSLPLGKKINVLFKTAPIYSVLQVMHGTFLTNQRWQVGSKSACIQSKTQHESIIDRQQPTKKAKVSTEHSDVDVCCYSICTTFISILFFSSVRNENGTVLNSLWKICLGDRKESDGTFLILKCGQDVALQCFHMVPKVFFNYFSCQ